LKKYYGRLSLRRELVYVFRYIYRQLRLTQQECFLMLLLLFAEICRWLSPEGIRRVVSDAYGRLFWGSSVSTGSANISILLELERVERTSWFSVKSLRGSLKI